MLGGQRENHLGVLLGEKAHGLLLLVEVAFDDGFLDDTSAGVDDNLHEVIFKGDKLFGALGGCKEDAGGVKTLSPLSR